MAELQKGDTVRLKSGGPVMTVSAHMTGAGFACQWFVGGELKDGLFQPESLVKVTAEGKPVAEVAVPKFASS